MIWAAVLATAAGCYLLKLAGLSVPPRVLDARAAGLAYAVVALVLRAPFIVVVVGAAAVAAVLRALT